LFRGFHTLSSEHPTNRKRIRKHTCPVDVVVRTLSGAAPTEYLKWLRPACYKPVRNEGISFRQKVGDKSARHNVLRISPFRFEV